MIIKKGEWFLFGARTIAVTFFPYIFLRKSYFDRMPQVVYDKTICHESIHIAQQKELLVIFFYLFYFLEFFIKFFRWGAYTYENLSFEKEAYQNESNLDYLSSRGRWAFLKYM